MEAYKLEILVIDHDQLGGDEISRVIENTKYSNWCISPSVEKITGKDIGAWHDDHPLNKPITCTQEYNRLFSGEQMESKLKAQAMESVGELPNLLLREGGYPHLSLNDDALKTKLLNSVKSMSFQTGESVEDIVKFLTDDGGLTTLMLAYFCKEVKP